MVSLARGTVRRDRAERIIVAHQLALLERSRYRIMCEYYAAEGGPCEGLNRFSDEELIELYRRHIRGIESLQGKALLAKIIDYEAKQLRGGRETTCSIMERAGRLCDGLARFSNLELTIFFAEALGGRRVVD